MFERHALLNRNLSFQLPLHHQLNLMATPSGYSWSTAVVSGRVTHDNGKISEKSMNALRFIKQTCKISPYAKDSNGYDAFHYAVSDEGWVQAIRQEYSDDPSVDKA